MPLEIIVAVDVSGSMKDAMPQVKGAVKKFLTALRPSDRVTLIGFNDNVFTLARPAVDLATRLKAVDRLAPWGGTALYDVIVQAIEQLGRQTGRRVLVVFTDGEDLNSHIALDAAERRLEASDAVLYPIGQGRAPKVKELKTVLERLARKSGGRAFFSEHREARRGVRQHPRGAVEPVSAGLRARRRPPRRALARALGRNPRQGLSHQGAAGLSRREALT